MTGVSLLSMRFAYLSHSLFTLRQLFRFLLEVFQFCEGKMLMFLKSLISLWIAGGSYSLSLKAVHGTKNYNFFKHVKFDIFMDLKGSDSGILICTRKNSDLD